MTTEQIKEKTELRVYHTMERLRYDFNQFIRSDFLQDKYNAKVKPYQEIYIPNVYRMIFTLDEKIAKILHTYCYDVLSDKKAIDTAILQLKALFLAELKRVKPEKKSSRSVADLQVEMLSKTYDHAYNQALSDYERAIEELLK